MDWTAALDDIRTDLKNVNPAIAEVNGAFATLAKAATKPGALDTKTKEIIAIGIAIAGRCNDCIGLHMRAAIKQGMTREELAETIDMAVYMGGGPSLMYGAKAMAAFDQLSNK